MIINKNSWHYKVALMGTVSSDIPRSLCPYFWLVVFKCFMLFAGFSALTMLSWTIGVDIATWLFAQIDITLTNWTAALPGILIGATLISSAIGTVIGGYKVKERINEKRDEKRWAKIKAGEEIPKNLVVEFIKAKHEKVCPRLEFK